VLVSTHYMDEAERCHEIAYIAYGELLAQGTVAAVVENAHLATYTVTGADLAGLAERLRQTPGVDMVAPFGTALHVSGRDAGKLEAAIAPLRQTGAQQWRRDAPTLEDVFIDLMSRSTDNFG
jgi:ABC-2 type transport system ATP-binding protein